MNINLTGWKYLFTFGYSGDVYAKGNQRRIVDRRTGQLIVEYKI